MVTLPSETCSAEPVSEKILLSPSSVMLALELPFTSIASLLLLILISLMVTFAVAFSDVLIVIVFAVSTELSRCVITGASSGVEVLPCVTVCPESPASTVTSPSSRYQSAAYVVSGRLMLMTSAIIPAVSCFIFIDVFLPYFCVSCISSCRENS